MMTLNLKFSLYESLLPIPEPMGHITSIQGSICTGLRTMVVFCVFQGVLVLTGTFDLCLVFGSHMVYHVL